MRSSLTRACLVALLAVGCQAAMGAELPAPIPVRDFFVNPPISRPTLSDDGNTYALIRSQGDLQAIFSVSVATGEWVPLAKVDDPETRLAWIEWANSKRLFISAQARDRNVVGVRSRTTRLFGVDSDGKNFSMLGRHWPLFGQGQLSVAYQDRIVHWTPADPQTVLIELWPPNEDSPSVMRMDVDTGRLARAQPRTAGIRNWYADAAGHIRAGDRAAGTSYRLYARIDPDADLELVMERPLFGQRGPEFAGFHADPALLYVLAPHEGRDALFEFDIRTRALGKLVFAHPEVDVTGVYREAGPESRVVGVRYTVDRPEIHFFDPADAQEHRRLAAAFQQEFGVPMQHERISRSHDGVRQLIEVSSEIQPPVYYFFDRSRNYLARILEQRPGIKAAALSPTRRVNYQARDGMQIPAYLTLPKGHAARNLPLIVDVHGGPWTRDRIEWDPEVQVLANRGFAVLQVNFRGSAGFGYRHLEAGYRQWGRKIQDDITDGVRWAIEQGIADADRIGIMGSSYGGYATLVGLTKTPELYRAGAAYAAVTDIEFLLSDDKWYDWGADWHETMIGGERGDKSRLREDSPLRLVDAIRAPVLLGHGTDDQRVHVRQSQRMAEALRKARKQYEYLEFPNEHHGFLLEANRVKWYETLVAFFQRNLEPRSPATQP
ncbi:MAG TPA: S9 family peptidase [Steroidobacteraceae bacterium]|nr:S9 family peptidase [Steroidobacteraceae bacterium]